MYNGHPTIVGGPNHPTMPLSQLISVILKPFLIHIKCYVKDKLDFLRKCSRKNNDTTILVTFDIQRLYTSIPHDYGLETISSMTEKHPDSLHSRFSKGFVLESIKIIIVLLRMSFIEKLVGQLWVPFSFQHMPH